MDACVPLGRHYAINLIAKRRRHGSAPFEKRRVIAGFRHKGLRRLTEDDDARGVPGNQAAKIQRILFALQEAEEVADMAGYPGWRLHPLKGELRGFWSVTITGNWRIIFRFQNGDAFDVDLID